MEGAPAAFHPEGVATRVLIVDDQREFRRVARELLTRRGYRVVGEAGCGLTALEAAARQRPDAILLDVRLGDESGVDVAQALSRACPGAAVLLVSNADYGTGGDLLRSTGASGFLLKARLATADLSAYWPSA